MREGRVQTDLGAHHAQAVGAEEPDAVAADVLDQRPLELLAARAGFRKAGREHHRRPDSGPRAGFDDARDGGRGGRDHREVEPLRDLLHRGEAGKPKDLAVRGIDGEQPAGVGRLQEVAHEDGADRLRAFARSDHGD